MEWAGDGHWEDIRLCVNWTGSVHWEDSRLRRMWAGIRLAGGQ